MFTEILQQRLAGIAALTRDQLAALDAHYQLMVRWNQALNLTKIIALDDAVERHYVESLFLGAHLPSESLSIADIGSGPGFPGFPVAILRPDCEVTLIESHQRKAVFLREASRSVKNVRVVAKRAEDVGDRFDLAISRAVSYEDLHGLLGRLAPCVSLLTGGEPPPTTWACAWEEKLPVPGGKSRFLHRGKCST